MIEKLDKHLASNINSCNMSQNIMVAHKAIEKINEIVELLNAIVVDIDGTKCIDGSKSRPENVITDKDYITITADDVLVGGESVRKYNGEEIYNYYHLPAYFKEIRDDVAEQGIKLLEIHCLQSSTNGEYAKTGNPTPDKNGCSAWCRCVWEKDGEKHTGAWVFGRTFSSAADCADYCAYHCAFAVRFYSAFRAAVFGGQD